jgi:hypothetical protein
MQVFIYCKITLHVSQQPSCNVAKCHVAGRLLLRYYDLFQKLQLQFYVLLMMGGMDTRSM